MGLRKMLGEVAVQQITASWRKENLTNWTMTMML